MLPKILQLIFGFISGYLFIIWITIPIPFSPQEFISGMILEPIKFFAAAIAFLAGFLFHAAQIKDAVQLTTQLLRKNKVNKWKLCFSYQVILSFSILFTISKWLTILLFCFACIYGMISVGFLEKRNKTRLINKENL